jgi:hypothetical protein
MEVLSAINPPPTAPLEEPVECSICTECIDRTTGKSILGCGHEFHLKCIVQWFFSQQVESSCPCCRHAVGALDNVPTEEEIDGSDDDSDDADSDDDSDGSSEDAIDDPALYDDMRNTDPDYRVVWARDENGIWKREIVITGTEAVVWNKVTESRVPASLHYSILDIQRVWRGYKDRRAARDTMDAEIGVFMGRMFGEELTV